MRLRRCRSESLSRLSEPSDYELGSLAQTFATAILQSIDLRCRADFPTRFRVRAQVLGNFLQLLLAR